MITIEQFARDFDQVIALKDGWCLMDNGSCYAIQRDDDQDVFVSDAAASRWVYAMAEDVEFIDAWYCRIPEMIAHLNKNYHTPHEGGGKPIQTDRKQAMDQMPPATPGRDSDDVNFMEMALNAARYAPDMLRNAMDISDEELGRLRTKLEKNLWADYKNNRMGLGDEDTQS